MVTQSCDGSDVIDFTGGTTSWYARPITVRQSGEGQPITINTGKFTVNVDGSTISFASNRGPCWCQKATTCLTVYGDPHNLWKDGTQTEWSSNHTTVLLPGNITVTMYADSAGSPVTRMVVAQSTWWGQRIANIDCTTNTVTQSYQPYAMVA